ncbi:MAG: MptD family putative ECF transporter S component [Eubacteriales bacterium]|nr:MptD family putative ECF transporter S component [Eubacteriales bacterium]
MKKAVYVLGSELIYFLIIFICAFAGIISPFCWVFQPVISIFFAAAPVYWLCLRLKKPGTLALLPGIFVVLMIAMGEYHGAVQIGAAIAALVIGEVVRLLIGYDNIKGIRYGYAFAGLVSACQPLWLWINKEAYYEVALAEIGKEAYAAGLMPYASPVCLAVLILLGVCAGCFGCVAAEKIFKEENTN